MPPGLRLEDDFTAGLAPPWNVMEAGHSRVIAEAGALRLTDLPTPGKRYTNAQITDYSYRDFRMRWRPPARLTVAARASVPASELRGTAGFGFWNHPLSPGNRRLPRLPRAAWFFFSAPPGDLRLAYGVPGPGWKAATIDAASPRAWALAPLALPVAILCRVPALYRRLWPPIQRRLRISERLLDNTLLESTHTYTIDWREDGVSFFVDGELAHTTPGAPGGGCGFIAWIDNQYAVLTPQAHVGWGLTPLEREQSLIIEHVVVEAADPD